MSQALGTAERVQPRQLYDRILRHELGNVAFADLVRLVVALGFREVGGRGSHRVFARRGVAELINLQQDHGQAKRYQVRQIAVLIRRYDLQLEDDE